MKKKVVISAVNFHEGGPLTILRDCLYHAARTLPENWEIIALVNSKESFEDDPRVIFYEFPNARRSWFVRLFLEWFWFRLMFRPKSIDLWLSLHDVTAWVSAARQVVYCHNPSPFYSISAREAFLEPKFLLFNKLYIYLYGMFIKRNSLVIVQQDWIRNKFQENFGKLPVVVAHPDVRAGGEQAIDLGCKNVIRVIYPTFPRVFKNIEVVMEAMRILSKDRARSIEFFLTISGNENRYARFLYKKYKDIKGVHFIGRKSSGEMAELYQSCSAVVFPSKLETWGLPITEAKAWGKPVLVADLPYAHETVGVYNKVRFLPPSEPSEWAVAISSLNSFSFKGDDVCYRKISEPFVSNWSALWRLVIDRL